MKNYRPKYSIYLLISCQIIDEMQVIQNLTNDLFEKSSPQKLLILRGQINKLISFVEKLPIYGKSDLNVKERKIKGSIYSGQKILIIDELKKININIIDALSTGKDRILKGADVLDEIIELRRYIYNLPVFWYDNEAEKNSQYSYLFEMLKKRKKRNVF